MPDELNIYEWLNDYRKLQRRIEYLEFKLEQSKAELSRWESGDLSKQPVTKGSIAADLINGEYIKRDEYELACLMNMQFDLKKFINKFDDLDSQILRMKYIEGKTLYVIAEELAYSYSNIRVRHQSLLKTIKFLDNTKLYE